MHFEKKRKEEERDKARRREREKETGGNGQKGAEKGTVGWVWCTGLLRTGLADW